MNFRSGKKKAKDPVVTIDDDDDWVKIGETKDDDKDDETALLTKADDDWVQVSSSKEEDITKTAPPFSTEDVTTILTNDTSDADTVDRIRDLLSESAFSGDQTTIGSKLAQKFCIDTGDTQLQGYATPYYESACAYDDPSWTGIELPQTSTECRRKFKYLIRRGIPDHCRRKVWLAASGAAEMGRSPASLYEAAWKQTFGTSDNGGKEGSYDDDDDDDDIDDGSTLRSEKSSSGGGDRKPVIGSVPTFGGSFKYSQQYISERGVEAAKRLLCIIATVHPEIEFSPFMPAIVVILLGFMKEAEAFAVIEAMINSTKKAKVEEEKGEKKSVFKQLLFLNRTDFVVFTKSFDSFMKKKYSKLVKKISDLGVSLEDAARSLFESFFSDFLSHPIILRIFDAFINEGVRIIFRVAAALITSFKFTILPISTHDEFREYFIQYSLQQDERMLKQAFGITISDSKIRKLNKTHLSSAIISTSSDSLQDAGRVYYRPKMSTTSEIISYPDLEAIWSFLPRRFIITDPVLLFTTTKNGFNIRTMIESTKGIFPILGIVKARDYAFGFYCPDSLYGAEQDKAIGTGESFVFSIRPEMKMFPWTRKNNSFFILSNRNHLLTVGSGGTGAGIVLTEDLNVQSWACATFDNIPLAGKIGTEKEIPCTVVEVYTLE